MRRDGNSDANREPTRRDFVKVAGGGSLVAASGGLAAAAGAPPNIVFVFADQHRNCSWPGGGDAQVKAPNLEVLGRQGAVFKNAISNYPLCSPHRASLLTGRYPQSNTVTQNVSRRHRGLPTTEVTIAGLLKKAGYATGYVGKWHLYPAAPEGKLVPPGPHRHGFDYWRVCHNYRKRYDTRCFDDNGKEFVLPDYAPKCQMDMTLDFIEKNAARPFCVFLSWHPPHAPYPEAPRRFVEMYSPQGIKLRPNVPKSADTPAWREAHVGYFSHVTALDEEIGRLMRKLVQLGIASNTIVCYSSDHGDMLGSFGLTAKRKPWEESINVPFVIRWPAGIPAGQRLDTLFSTVDITPTLLGLAGQPVPSRIEGADLSAILRGGQAGGPASAFIMAIGGNPADRKEAQGGWRGVRTARFTYAAKEAGSGLAPWLLYDNQKDPYQMHNLIDDAAHCRARKELESTLSQWRKRAGEE